MASLANQTISTSYGQLLKTVNVGGIDGTLQAIEDGDGTTSALQLSSAGVRSTGTLNAAGATTLSSTLTVTGAATLSSTLSVASTSTFTGAATFGTSLTASTGTATIGTLAISGLVTGPATFGTNVTISTGTATVGTLRVTGPSTLLGATTLGSSLTASTGTSTIGTLAVSGTSTFTGLSTFTNSISVSTNGTFGGNLSVTGTATLGTVQIGSGSNLIAQSYGTAAFTATTLGTYTTASAFSTGTFALANVAANDIVIGSINYTVGGGQPAASFRPESAGVVRYVVQNATSNSLSTLSAGTIFATALRYS